MRARMRQRELRRAHARRAVGDQVEVDHARLVAHAAAYAAEATLDGEQRVQESVR
jgi:hypothetical protein